MSKTLYPVLLALIIALVLGSSWIVWKSPQPQASKAVAELSRPIDPLRIILTPLNGDSALDRDIRSLQSKIESEPNRSALLERLGWAFVAKARLISDPGFYVLAEQAANAIMSTSPDDPAALLLLGHIRDAQHRFADAETIARRLVTEREFVFDYALLGDALMEQGKLGEAVEAYQKMVDLKPCLQTYSRVAHMRWLKGDLPGALTATRLAVSAGSPREPEPTAWAYSRLASYQLQAGEMEDGLRSTDLALQFAPDYAPALLVRGRLLLAQEKSAEAVVPLRQAAEISPLPEYLWTLAEALRASADFAEAEKVEAQLVATGAAADPRTFALFLATRGQDAPLALRLAFAELESRQDVFTHDAIAWAQLASGEVEKARESVRLALAEGTEEGRLFYHAGTIAAASGAEAEALEFFRKARALEQTLLPSERQALGHQTAALLASAPQFSAK